MATEKCWRTANGEYGIAEDSGDVYRFHRERYELLGHVGGVLHPNNKSIVAREVRNLVGNIPTPHFTFIEVKKPGRPDQPFAATALVRSWDLDTIEEELEEVVA